MVVPFDVSRAHRFIPGSCALPRLSTLLCGGVSERPKEHASKACVGVTPPWVQIPPPPLASAGRDSRPALRMFASTLTGMPVAKETKLAGAVFALVVIAFLPGFLLGVFSTDGVAQATALGAIGALTCSLMAGPRFVLGTAIPFGIAAGLVVVAADVPWLAFVVMGLAAGLSAWTARFGLAGAVSLMPIMLAFLLAKPPQISTDVSAGIGFDANALWVGVCVAAGAAWMAIVSWVVHRRLKLPELHRLTPSRSLAYAITLGLFVGTASAVMVGRDWGHGGAWFVMTLIIVMQPYLQDSWHKALERGVGTIGGVVIAVAIASVVDASWLKYVIAVACLFFAVRLRMQPNRPYWGFVLLLTPAVVLIEGQSASVDATALARLTATLGAVAIGLIAVQLFRPFVKPTADRAGFPHS